MKNDPLAAELYNKMQQEQNEYREWLLAQPPEEILNHAYEYSSREDILIALENVSLRPAQLRALLESQAPMADIYKDYRDHDTNALDIMAMCIEDRADIDLMESTKKSWPPVYYQTGRYAREHEELPQYRASMKLNEECRDEIDDAISYNYNGLCLDDGAVQQVLAGYGAERTRYIIAAAIQVRDGDARISPQNRRWADKITAKLGSDYKKPDAITVIEPDNYKQIVYPLPVGDLLYVGNATQRKLGSYGIRTIGQLAETNPEVLKGWFGVMGYTLSAFARGLDQTPVAKQDAHSAIKSVGNSATTPRDLTTDEDVWLMLVLLSESVAMRMRDLGSKCNVVEIYVRDNELSGFTRRRKLDNPTNVSIEIARIAFELFKRNYSWPKPLRGIGVRGADLCPADCAVQLGFFSNEEKREKLEHIDKAVDTLRQRYGYRSVQRAVVYTDPVLGGINAYDDHNIHPVGYFHTA